MKQMDNTARAHRAMHAIEAYCGCEPGRLASNEGLAEAIGDLIGDLMHLADRFKIDAIDMVRNGVSHHDHEIRYADGIGPASHRVSVTITVTS